MIAFVGSVFSPYYAWSGRRDPLNHCAINVALYGPRGRWAMTERGRGALTRGADWLSVGPSALRWDGGALTIEIDEICAPLPRRLRGRVRLEAAAINQRTFVLEAKGAHVWRPIAPVAQVRLEMQAPELAWSGSGYFDSNFGDEPLEAAFARWTWSRARTRAGASVLYDATRRREGPLALALRFGANGGCEPFAPPPRAPLPRSLWRLARETRSDDARASLRADFEDGPFYARARIAHRLDGAAVESVHESLSLERFASPLVRAMLPFRMPRRL